MERGLSKPACMGVVMFLAGLAGASTYALAQGFLLAGAMGIVALVAFLWHLEENTRVVIRPEDHVAIYELRRKREVSWRHSSLEPEESLS